MKNFETKTLAWTQIVLLSGVLQIPFASAAPTSAERETVGKVSFLKGLAQSVSVTGVTTLLKQGAPVYQGDTVKTNAQGGIKLLMSDKTTLTLGASSVLIVTSYKKDEPAQVSLINGQIRAQVSKASDGKVKFFLKTKTAAMGVRGTEFETTYNPQTQMSSTVTYEGLVNMSKAEPSSAPLISQKQAQALDETSNLAAQLSPPVLAPAQIAAIAAAEQIVKQKSNDLTPAETQAFGEVNKLADAARANPTTPITPTQAQLLALSTVGAVAQKEAQAAIDNAPPPQVTSDQIKAAGKLQALVDAKVNSSEKSPAQQKAMDTVKEMAAKSAEAPANALPTTLTKEQSGALLQVQAMANAAVIPPPSLKPDDAQAMAASVRAATSGVSLTSLSLQQKEALVGVQQAAIQAASTGAPVALTPAQVAQMTSVQKMAQENIKTGNVPAADIVASTKAAAAVAAAQDPAKTLPPDVANALVQMKQASAVVSAPPPGFTAAQVSGISTAITTGQAAGFAAAPVASKEQVKMMEDVQNTALKNIDRGALTPAQAQAVDRVAALVNKPENPAGAIAITPADAKAIAMVQNMAVASATVAQTAQPMDQLIKISNDPAKSVAMTQGQFSGVAAAQASPSIPTKINPSQFASMKSSDLTAAAPPPAAASASSSKAMSIVPPGVSAQAVGVSAADQQKMMLQTVSSEMVGKAPGAPGAAEMLKALAKNEATPLGNLGGPAVIAARPEGSYSFPENVSG